MSSIRGYHRLGELRLVYGPRVARAVISAVRAHAEIVRVDPDTGAEVGGHARADDGAYVAPEVWAMLTHVASEYEEHLEIVSSLQDTCSRLAGMARQDRKLVKQGKKVLEQQQKELLEAQKRRDAPAEGQLENWIAQNSAQLAEFEGDLDQHTGRLRACEDLLQRLI